MHLTGDRLVLSPTDLVGHLACEHLTTLEHRAAFGRHDRPTDADPNNEIIRKLGDEHEQAVLDDMRHHFGVTEIPRTADPAEGARLTVEAMRSGAERIFQATFFDGRWRGHADFLIRNDERQSVFGAWSYDVADTKLARHLAVGALVQMGIYARQLTEVQQVAPARLTVILGDREHVSVPYADVAAYVRRAADEFELWLDDPPETYPVKVTHCDICPWAATCRQRWRTDDDLITVAFLRRDQRQQLRDAGITTVTALGGASDADLASVGESSRRRLSAQARLQVEARTAPLPPYEPVLPVEPERGLALLPEPDPADLFLDLEGDPFYGPRGLEYLWGISDAADRFTAWWAHDPPAERRAFEQVVDHIMAAWKRSPGMHVYHYAPYEPSRLKDLSQRHASRIDEVDALLRGQRLVDLYAVVRQGLRIGTESYSIKALEPLYDESARAGAMVKDAAASIVEYERWRATNDQSILDAIEAYNRDDCVSTRRLRDWLEKRRAEVEASGREVLRPSDSHTEAEVHHRPPDPALVAIEARLTVGLPTDPEAYTADDRAKTLLAGLLQWHRREHRADWWEYFRVRQLSLDEIADDPAALGGLREPRLLRAEGRSAVWRYSVAPQECRLRPGDRVDHSGGSGSSILLSLDLEHGTVELKRAVRNEHPHPAGLLPSAPVDTGRLADALRTVAAHVAERGLGGEGPLQGARDLLSRANPRLGRNVAVGGDGSADIAVRRDSPADVASTGAIGLRVEGESDADALVRVAPHLTGVLPVQGPPGSGKTYAGARAIVAMVRSGLTVGICGPSHRAITNLLDETLAADTSGSVAAIQKSDGGGSARPGVQVTANNAEVENALATGRVNLVAGTAWLFARDGIDVDTLVVDEAGQLSLATTVAAASATGGLILLGDPQQLPQPAKGVHPPGTEVSALDHVLGGHDTLPPERGLFLSTTHRMHPAVCAPVSALSYEGRLRSRDGLDRQVVGDQEASTTSRAGMPPAADDSPPLSGAGVRWWPVPHSGRGVHAPEEVDVVDDIVAELSGRLWTDAAGLSRPLTPDDVLVVAPYNVQVAHLSTRLAGRARVGTVDKFQGQQAPVVILSLTTSSASDAPRGVHFVANRNRLNVAVSRARSLAVLVGSPALLTSPVRTLEQLRGVNALCTLVDAAGSVRPSAGEP